MIGYLEAALDIDLDHALRKVPARVGPKRRYATTYVGPGVDPIPPTPSIMDPEHAAAVLAILPRSYLAGTIQDVCSCQYGICGSCDKGRCDRCLTIQLHGPKRSPLTHITDKRGFCTSAPGVSSSAVWSTTAPCRYICPCRCPKTPPAPAPVVQVAEQVSLW